MDRLAASFYRLENLATVCPMNSRSFLVVLLASATPLGLAAFFVRPSTLIAQSLRKTVAIDTIRNSVSSRLHLKGFELGDLYYDDTSTAFDAYVSLQKFCAGCFVVIHRSSHH